MNKVSVAELAKAVAAKHGLQQKNAEAFVAECFSVINEGLRTDKAVKVRGLGTFKVVDVRERESINVNTGERVTIEGHGKISFTPDPIMRDLVNKPFAKFETVALNEGVNIDELNKIGGELSEDDSAEDTDFEPAFEGKEEKETAVEPEIKEIAKCEEPVAEPKNDEILKTEVPFSESETLADEPEERISCDEKEPASEKAETESEQTEYEAEDEEPSFAMRHKALFLLLGGLLIAAIGFAGGYLLGQEMASRPVFKTVKVYNVAKQKSARKLKTTPDTAKTASEAERQKPVSAIVEAEQTAQTAQKAPQQKLTEPKEKAEAATAASSLAQRQVRTGAYNITGTELTITVRKAQTLKSISKAYLGEGMECYIQVHNGIDDVKEGMKLKIPKLKLKKR